MKLSISGKGGDIQGYCIALNGVEIDCESLRLSLAEVVTAKISLNIDEIEIDAEALTALETIVRHQKRGIVGGKKRK